MQKRGWIKINANHYRYFFHIAQPCPFLLIFLPIFYNEFFHIYLDPGRSQNFPQGGGQTFMGPMVTPPKTKKSLDLTHIFKGIILTK